MATSTLKNAFSTTPSLPEELGGADPEYSAQMARVKEAETKLRELLMQRQEPGSSMYSVAGALLDPGRTGSFGEALGRAATAYGSSQEAQQNRAKENAMMRYQLEQSAAAGKQEAMGQKMFTDIMSGRGAQGAPGALAAPTGAAAPGATPTAPGEAQATPSAPVVSLTPAVIAKATAVSPKYGKILGDMYKLDQDRFAIAQNGTVFDKQTQQYLNIPVPGQTQSEYYFPDAGGSLKATPSEYAAYSEARKLGKGADWIKSFTGAGGAAEVPTIESRAVKAAGETVTAQERAKSDVKAGDEIVSRGESAYPTMSAADRIAKLAKTNPNAFGQLANPGLLSSLGTLVRDGLSTPTGSISIKSIEEAILKANPKTSAADLKAAAMAAADMSQLELEYARIYLQGQGAVTENERAIVRRLGPSMSDRPDVIAEKAELLRKRKQFDLEVGAGYQEFREKTNGSVSKYKSTPEYKALKDAYQEELSSFAGAPRPQPTGGAPGTPARATPGPLSTNAIQDELRRRGLIK